MDRRTFLKTSMLVALGLGGCGPSPARQAVTTTTSSILVPDVAKFVQRVENTSKIAFTFHGGGPLALTQAMLAKLRELQTHVTVFAIGEWLQTNNGLARQILDDGHELANHTFSHPAFSRLTEAQMLTEITRCKEILIAQTGSPGHWFRPSSEDAVPPDAVLRQAMKAGYPVVVGFDVDPLDYQDPGAAAINSRVAAKVRGGSIVSLHFGHAGTIEAMSGLVQLAKDKGLAPVTVSELLDA